MDPSQRISFPQMLSCLDMKTLYVYVQLVSMAENSEERGAVFTSENILASSLEINRSTLRRCIDKLIDANVLNKEANKTMNKPATKITICDFDSYGTPPTRQRTRKRTSSRTREKPSDNNNVDFVEVVQKPSNEEKLNERKHAFGLSLVPFMQSAANPNGYPPLVIREFFDYWTEPDQLKKKMRCEMQKTWDTARRLRTWANNNINKNGNRQPNNSMAATQQRLDEFLAFRADYDQRCGSADDDEPLF